MQNETRVKIYSHVRKGIHTDIHLARSCKRYLENFAKFNRKTSVLEPFLTKSSGLHLIRKELYHRCFPINLGGFFRTSIYQFWSTPGRGCLLVQVTPYDIWSDVIACLSDAIWLHTDIWRVSDSTLQIRFAFNISHTPLFLSIHFSLQP